MSQLSVKANHLRLGLYKPLTNTPSVKSRTVRFGDTPLFQFGDKLTDSGRLILQTQILKAVKSNQLEKAADLYVKHILNRPSMEALKKDPDAFRICHDARTWYTLNASLWSEAFGLNRPKESLLSWLTSGKWPLKRDLKNQQDWETRVELQKKLLQYLYNELLPTNLGQNSVAALRKIPHLPVLPAAKLYKKFFLDVDLDEYRNDPAIPPEYMESRAFSGWLSQSDQLACFVREFDAIEAGKSFSHSNNPNCLNGPLPIFNEFLHELGPTQMEQRDLAVQEAWRKDMEHSRLVAEKALYLAGAWHYDKIKHRLLDEDFVLKPGPDFVSADQRKGFIEKVLKHFPSPNKGEAGESS